MKPYIPEHVFEILQTQPVREKRTFECTFTCNSITVTAALKLTVKNIHAKLHPGAEWTTPASFQTTLCLLSVSKVYHTHSHTLATSLPEFWVGSHCPKLLADSNQRVCVCDMKGCMCDIKTQCGSFDFIHKGQLFVCQDLSVCLHHFSGVDLTPAWPFAEMVISQFPCHAVLACYCLFIPVHSLF